MIEVLAFPLVLTAAALFPKLKTNDKKTIQTIIKNIGWGMKINKEMEYIRFYKKVPILDGETEIGMTYCFTIPPGLEAGKFCETAERMSYFPDTLNRPVEVEFSKMKGFTKKTVNIHVYNEELSELIDFALVPEPPLIEVKGKQVPEKWVVPIGKSVKGWIWHNFEHTPHMTIAGTTRFGKSVLLRLIMTYLILYHPNDVEFYIIDLKGRLEFNRYRNLKQIVEVAGTPTEAALMLNTLTNEDPENPGILEQEFVYYEKNYISNITETNIKKRRFIIIDEGAQLMPNKYTDDNKARELCNFKLSRIAALFGAIGVRMIYATQYPTAASLNPNVKMNADAKISFRLPAGYASEVAIDQYGAEKLPSHFKGRALMKTHELKEMQVPFITHSKAWELLERYQDPIKVEGEPENVILYQQEGAAAGGNTEHPGPNPICDTGTTSTHSRVKFES